MKKTILQNSRGNTRRRIRQCAKSAGKQNAMLMHSAVSTDKKIARHGRRLRGSGKKIASSGKKMARHGRHATNQASKKNPQCESYEQVAGKTRNSYIYIYI